MSYLLRDLRVAPWAWQERAALSRLDDAPQRSVYLGLTELDTGRGVIYASQDTVAQVSKVSTRTVGRVMPELEAKGLLRRATPEETAEIAEEIGRWPPSVVYFLVNVTGENTPAVATPELPANMPLQAQIEQAAMAVPVEKRISVAASVLARYWKANTGKDANFGWLNKMMRSIPPKLRRSEIMAEAMLKTIASDPRGDPFAYMQKVVTGLVQARTFTMPPEHFEQVTADLGSKTAEEFG